MINYERTIKKVRKDLEDIYYLLNKYHVIKEYEFILSEQYSIRREGSKTIPKNLKIITKREILENTDKSLVGIVEPRFDEYNTLFLFTTQRKNIFSKSTTIDCCKEIFFDFEKGFEYFYNNKNILTKKSRPDSVKDNTFNNLSDIIYSTKIALERTLIRKMDVKVMHVYSRYD